MLEIERDHVVVRHLYIERRMIPLNLYLERADDAQREHAMREYGDAIEELAAVNIFAGDLLFKNFGVTRYGRVVFYDYDEIEYLTACNFRRIPPPPPGWDEMSGDVWYPVGPRDVFPEEFATFLLTDPRTRECFLRYHADLLDAAGGRPIRRRCARASRSRCCPIRRRRCAFRRARRACYPECERVAVRILTRWRQRACAVAPSLAPPCARGADRRSARRGVRDAAEQGRRGSREEHVRLHCRRASAS